MDSPNPFRVLFSLLSGVYALLILGLAAVVPSQAAPVAPPAGDLTVTVHELKNGSVKLTVSGTAYAQDYFDSDGLIITNFSLTDLIPPANGNDEFGAFPLPEGLKLTIPANFDKESPIDDSSDAVGGTVDIPLSVVLLSDWWALAAGELSEPFWGIPIYTGDAIIGSGSVTTNEVPFSIFVPGTYLVRPGCGCGGPRDVDSESKSEGGPAGVGLFPYFITYKVIPYSEGLTVEKPKRFQTTRVGRSSRTQTLVITNEGSLPLSGLKVGISNANGRNFKVTQPTATTLEAGVSTVFTAAFKPRKLGRKRAQVIVTDGNLEQKITLRGKGYDYRVNGSPRFPHGPK